MVLFEYWTRGCREVPLKVLLFAKWRLKRLTSLFALENMRDPKGLELIEKGIKLSL